MKTLGLMILILLLSLSFQAVALDKCLTGSWYDPENSGSGIDIQVLEDNIATAKFYTYGSDGQAWYVMNGEDGILDMIVTVKAEGVVTEYWVGWAHVGQIDNDTISFEYEIKYDADKGFTWCLSGFCNGDLVYTRITKPIPCD